MGRPSIWPGGSRAVPPRTDEPEPVPPMKRKGFTILELLITLVVIACLASLAIPAFFSRPEVTLENAAVLLAKDLRTAQNRCAYEAEPCRFEFLEGGRGYRVVDLRGELVEHPATLQPFLRDYAEDAVFEGVEVADFAIREGDAIRYDARGYCETEARITLSFMGDVRTLILSAERGRIRILGSTSDWTDDHL